MKAVVLEVRGQEAALLMADGTVRRARGDYQVGQEIEFYDFVRSGPRQWVAAVLIAAILLAGSVGMWFNNNYVAYAEVSLDVDPSSIVYTLNARNRVLSVWTASDDAAQAVSAEDLRFKPIDEAVSLTLEQLSRAGYMDGADDCLLASVSSDDEKRRERLAEQVEDAIADVRKDGTALEYRVERTDRATARAARENGMSPGRYAAWQQAGQGEPPADYAEMPVRQLLGGQPRHEAEAPAEPQPETEEPAKVQPKAEETEAVQPEAEEREEVQPKEDRSEPEQPEKGEAAQPQDIEEKSAEPQTREDAQPDRKEEPPRDSRPGGGEKQREERKSSGGGKQGGGPGGGKGGPGR